jgi:alpha-ribazole phosphatase
MDDIITELVLVRHGEVECDERSLHGHIDVPLSAEGEKTLRAVGKRLAGGNFSAIYSSDLSRSVTSAELIAAHHDLTPAQNPAFRELNMGIWDGETMSKIWEDHSEKLKEWWKDPANFRPPEGENLNELRERVVPALKEVLENHQGETICLAAHAGVNRVVLFEALGLGLDRFYTVSQDYGCVNRLRYFSDGRAVVDLLNG